MERVRPFEALAPEAQALVDAALSEDVGAGDWTTVWTVPEDREVRARVVAKARGVIAGSAIAEGVLARVDPDVMIRWQATDGDEVAPGDEVALMAGRARSILTAERVVLNFLQRLSGVATLTSQYVQAVAGTGATILDTRKTTPGMRALEKAAVGAGGGANHRFGLHDMVLIKENHIVAAGGITEGVRAVRAHNRQGLRVEVETTNQAEINEALAAGVDRILFDNMTPLQLEEAVRLVRDWHGARVETEASGGVNLATVAALAATGVDFISVGALTHSAPALDLSLLVEL